MRRAPVGCLSGLIFCLTLGFAWPVLGEEEDVKARTGAQVERNRDGGGVPPKEVRAALARRKRNALSQFDPKVYEARGRELQGEYYEIATMAKSTPSWSLAPTEAEVAITAPAPEASSSRNWMIWSGAAGLAALVGGAAGYLWLEKHSAPDPITVHLDDKQPDP